jgi:asparagine synthetase A
LIFQKNIWEVVQSKANTFLQSLEGLFVNQYKSVFCEGEALRRDEDWNQFVWVLGQEVE